MSGRLRDHTDLVCRDLSLEHGARCHGLPLFQELGRNGGEEQEGECVLLGREAMSRWVYLLQSPLGGSLCSDSTAPPFLSKLHRERGGHILARRGLWTHF